MITQVAGTGTPGNAGDDGPATDAQLQSPDAGFLFADTGNNVVRNVSAD